MTAKAVRIKQRLSAFTKFSPSVGTPRSGVLNFDGACDRNPGGWTSGGYVLEVDGTRHDGGSLLCRPGHRGTNNKAEWHGLVIGLEKAQRLGVTHLKVFGDSQLVINQASGRWRVKGDLKPFAERVIALHLSFASVTYEWVRRRFNIEANKQAELAIRDGQKRFVEERSELNRQMDRKMTME